MGKAVKKVAAENGSCLHGHYIVFQFQVKNPDGSMGFKPGKVRRDLVAALQPGTQVGIVHLHLTSGQDLVVQDPSLSPAPAPAV